MKVEKKMKVINKSIVISFEGTDCSGKETQSKALEKKLRKEGILAIRFAFPDYDSPTGKIVGGPLLGKEAISKGWFPETSANMNPYLWSLYLAADRYYHKNEIINYLNKGYIVILDRWVESNMGIQSAKIEEKEKRIEFINWEEKLEYEMLKLPKPDLTFFLYMPFSYGKKLRENKKEALDENERNEDFQKRTVESYLELAKMKDFKTIDCVKENQIRKVSDIEEEIYQYVINVMKRGTK